MAATKKPTKSPVKGAVKDLRVSKTAANKVKGGAINLGPD
jgi:hypothetical protein